MNSEFLLSPTGTLAQLKALDNAMYGALSASSAWAVTSDSGQESHSAIQALSSWPASTTTYYQLWQLQDGLSPACIMKLSYICNTSGGNPNGLNVSVQFGTSSDTYGNLTGTTTPTMAVTSYTGTAATTTYNCYVSAGLGWLTLLLCAANAATTAGSGLLVVERSVNSSGVYANGFMFAAFLNGSTGGSMYVMTASGMGLTENWAAVVSSNTTTAWGNNFLWFPIFPMLGAFQNPIIAGAVCRAGDVTDQTQVTATIYGNAHNYIISDGSTIPVSKLSATWAVGLRYE